MKFQNLFFSFNAHLKLSTIFMLTILAFTLRSVTAQQAGVFTNAQAARGQALYDKRCAACHGANLTGGSSVPLVGARFMAKWGQGKHSVDELYYITRTQMPYGAAATMTNQEYIDMVAYILKANGYRSGERELSTDSATLQKIIIRPQTAAKGDAIETVSSNTGKSATANAQATLTGPTQQELNAAATNSSDWLLTNHDYAGTRFVDLKQINRQNAASLRPVFMYQAGDTNTFHTNPLVYRGVMILTTADSTIAIDATSGQVKWRYNWRLKGKPGWPVQRGVAIKDGYVVRGTYDGYLIALDIATGKLLWDRAIVDMTKNEGGFTMPPMIYEDLIIIGPAGSELGVKGWIGAFRLKDGSEVWRFNTIPDDGEPGAETWGKADARLKGGGSLWTPVSLDTAQNLLYFAVANPAPDFYGEARPGANLYTNCMVALDVRTGKLQWYYQVVPHDTHDWDLTQASPLFTATVNGKLRKLAATVGKSGVLHVVDRETHEKVYEVPVSSQLNADVPLTTQGVRVCPGIQGGVLWSGPAFNPRTNMLYVNSVEWCGTFGVAKELRYIEGQFYMGGFSRLDPIEQARGWLTAIDASTGKVQWRYKSNRQMVATVTTTSADLIFTGEITGDFLVLDARNGKELYRFNTGGPINGGVITYAINGKQYVAVMSGNATAFWQARPGSSTAIVFALP
ncbi:MAG: PQQ-binding-like beta-propeller repeat protein [Acidobacteriota bacterium]